MTTRTVPTSSQQAHTPLRHYVPATVVNSTLSPLTAIVAKREEREATDPFDQIIKNALPGLYDIFKNSETGVLYTDDEYAWLRAHTDERVFCDAQQEKAERLQGFITGLNMDIRTNLMALGWMLTRGERQELYKYIEGGPYDSMQSWATHMEIEPDVRTLAVTMVSAWPYMRQLNYPIEELANPLYTKAKLTYIISMNRDATRQVKANASKQKQLLLEQHAASSSLLQPPPEPQQSEQDALEMEIEVEEEGYGDYPDNEDGEEEEEEGERKIIVHELTPEQEEAAYATGYTEYVSTARAGVERIRDMPPQDFYHESTKQKGKSLGPSILVRNLRELSNGTWAFDGGIICSADSTDGITEDEWKAMERNHFSLGFQLAGRDADKGTLSPKELATLVIKDLYRE